MATELPEPARWEDVPDASAPTDAQPACAGTAGGVAQIPLVSVIMAVNRDDGYLQAAVASVLAQTLREIELLVIANQCHDSVWERLLELAARDVRLRPIRTPLGQLPYNLNVGLHHARGEFVARMDADDLALPERLARQLRFFRANPDVSVLGGGYAHMDAQGRRTGRTPRLQLSPERIHACMPYESCLAHPTVMMRRADVLAVGGYAWGMYAEDWDLWLRMRRAGMRFANLPEVVLHYRIHDGQSTAAQAFRRNMAHVQALLVREFVQSGDPRFVLSMALHLGSACLRLGVAVLKGHRARRVGTEIDST
jgi:cellulose synthase/poly-beta-1,6-N-acetylglucosamine synthase-like glycosyltransferase